MRGAGGAGGEGRVVQGLVDREDGAGQRHGESGGLAWGQESQDAGAEGEGAEQECRQVGEMAGRATA